MILGPFAITLVELGGAGVGKGRGGEGGVVGVSEGVEWGGRLSGGLGKLCVAAAVAMRGEVQKSPISPQKSPISPQKSPCNERSRSHESPLVLQHTATLCNTLQHTHCNTLQHTATHCNTLQHTATHCNTLQHTATISYVHTRAL